MASTRRLAVAFGVVLLVSLMGSRVQAQDAKDAKEELDRKPTKCVLANSISRKVAVDQRTVLFFMKGDKVYRNDLPATCSVLEPGESRLTYYYRTQSVKLTRLCDTDSFTVERKPGTACRLGQFNPITPDEAAILTGKKSSEPAAAVPPAQ
jgi:hypothetical protein